MKFTFRVTLFHCFRKLMKRILMEDGDGDEEVMMKKKKVPVYLSLHAHARALENMHTNICYMHASISIYCMVGTV